MNTYKLTVYKDKNPDVIEKIESGTKIHYIVIATDGKTISEWKESISNINAGKLNLSIVVNEPSEEYIVKQYDKVGFEEFTMTQNKEGEISILVGNSPKPIYFINEIAENNGMTVDEFKQSYFHTNKKQILSGLIIHVTDFRYN